MKNQIILIICLLSPFFTAAQGTIAPLDDRIFVNEFEPTIGIGGIIGWGTPYGWGMELIYQKTPHLDLNLGAGIGLSGIKSGFGGRYVFFHTKAI